MDLWSVRVAIEAERSRSPCAVKRNACVVDCVRAATEVNGTNQRNEKKKKNATTHSFFQRNHTLIGIELIGTLAAICIRQSHSLTQTHTDTLNAFCFYSDGRSTPPATTNTTNEALEAKQSFGARFIDKEPRRKIIEIKFTTNTTPIFQFFALFYFSKSNTNMDRRGARASAHMHSIFIFFQARPTHGHTELLSRSSFSHSFDTLRKSMRLRVSCFGNQLIFVNFPRLVIQWIFVFHFCANGAQYYIFVQFLDKDWQWTNRCLRRAPQSNRSRFTRLSPVRLTTEHSLLFALSLSHTLTPGPPRAHTSNRTLRRWCCCRRRWFVRGSHTNTRTHSTFDCVTHNCHSSMHASRESPLTLSNWIVSIRRRNTFVPLNESLLEYSVKYAN